MFDITFFSEKCPIRCKHTYCFTALLLFVLSCAFVKSLTFSDIECDVQDLTSQVAELPVNSGEEEIMPSDIDSQENGKKNEGSEWDDDNSAGDQQETSADTGTVDG
ncbi:hypothetical protein KIN20_027420 [Parelaphostrongylus tenuis]|uniref:Uncharacterized protein n=1 Tax=Parelaphostrongylus tenuis TaxID=148309 RepID=A0AAD5WDR9_PARTN|nr:hypothetical protein KIN20_027420 [Parelaphostrongylus tenuis]